MDPTSQTAQRTDARRAWWTHAAAPLVLAAIAAVCFGYLLLGHAVEGRAAAMAGAKTEYPLTRLCGKRFGDRRAGVQVQTFLPVSAGCQDDIGLYLVQVADALPDLVSV